MDAYKQAPEQQVKPHRIESLYGSAQEPFVNPVNKINPRSRGSLHIVTGHNVIEAYSYRFPGVEHHFGHDIDVQNTY